MNDLTPQVQHPCDQLAAAPSTSSPAIMPPKLTAQQQAAMDKATIKGNIVRAMAFPAAMASAIPISKEVGASGFKLYLDGVVKDAGASADPIERMLIEQLALAHQRVAQLHAQAEEAKSAEVAKVYLTAAIRLTGELRRLALALRQYRDPLPKRSFTVIRQQNLSAGRQQVAYVAQADSSGQIPFGHDGEQASKRLSHVPQANHIPESQACSGRPAEPTPARSANSKGARAAAANRLEEPAVEVLDGAADAGGQGPVRRKRARKATG